MNGTIVSEASQTPDLATSHWLLLTHHLPPSPAYFRVRIRRRLAAIGAVPVRNAVYALPANDATREDFEWLLREIVADGGEATLCEAAFIDGATDARLRVAFDAERSAAYEAIVEETDRLRRESIDRADARSILEALKRSLAAAQARDFFRARGRAEAEDAVSILEMELSSQAEEDAMPGDEHTIEQVSGRTWVTRRGVRVDRIASGCLIRRFVDPEARFRFVDPDGYGLEAGELRFDMFEGEFTHQGDRCTFEVLLGHSGLTDPALLAIGEIIHDIDLKEERFGRAETAGVASMVHGITATIEQDPERLRRGGEMLDSLYAHFRAEVLPTG
jgi:hypothetical protein